MENIDSTDLLDANPYEITNFNNFNHFLSQNILELREEICNQFETEDATSVIWKGENPFQKVCIDLWGCTELCPFCKEPCQHSEKNHTTEHKCLQHRPKGIEGTRDIETMVLEMTTCAKNITLKTRANCAAHSYKCRESGNCTGASTDSEEVFHDYKDYKIYLPDWDIAPDAADEASAYWKWAVCTFEREILDAYPGRKLEIPRSWKYTTLKDALDSLRKYTQ